MASVVAVSLLALFAGLLFFLAWVGWFWFCRPAGRPSLRLPFIAWERVRGVVTNLVWREVLSRLTREVGRLRPQWRSASRKVTLPLLLPLLLPLVVLMFLSLMRVFVHKLDEQAFPQENPVVSAVLGEAGLLAPPVLPPSAFAGEGGRDFGLADRDWSKLDPDFRLVVFRLLKRLEAREVRMTLVEGYRSPARQERLAAEQALVTRARGFESRHQYGLAVDLAPLVDGRAVFAETDGRVAMAYQALGEEAEAMGLVWGGRWSFRDLMHVEAPGVIRENMAARVQAISAAGR